MSNSIFENTLQLDAELDRLTAAGESHHVLIGGKARWHNGRLLPIVAFGETIALEKTLRCYNCGGGGKVVYLKSGLHAGAFCYACNKQGELLADLRDQQYACEDCSIHPDEAIENIVLGNVGSDYQYPVKAKQVVVLVNWGEHEPHDYDAEEGDLSLRVGMYGEVYDMDNAAVPARIWVSLDERPDHDVLVLAHHVVPFEVYLGVIA